MNRERADASDPGVREAIAELQGLIGRKYQNAAFETTHGDDPEGLYLTAIVDVEDTDQVFDLVVDRLIEMQVDEHLPIYVVPVKPPERVAKELEQQATKRHVVAKAALTA